MKKSSIAIECSLRCLVAFVAVALAMVGCNGGSTIGVPTIDLQVDPDTATEDVIDADQTADIPGAETLPRTDLLDIGGACKPGDGCFLDPCDENADCVSSLCVTHMGDQVCTQECVEECPDGWSCQQVNVGPDVMFACISNFPFLCMPCHQDLDCTASWGGVAVCVDYGEVGRFCGGTCDADLPCPIDFDCAEMTGTGGGTSMQCIPGSGECACSQTSVKLALSTTCSVSNDFGTCEGLRVCTEDGLTDCDAPAPAEEVCDGVDNDCDGVVDGDGLCDDDSVCTADSCGGADGCVYEVLEGLACDDGTACTEGDFCQGGVCAGVPISCDDGNPCTDDVCDPETGCQNTPNTDLCDDGDPCTVGDHCVDAACLGTPVACDCETDADCEVIEDGDICNGTLFCDIGEVPFKCKVDPATVITCPAPEGLDGVCQTAVCDGKTGDCLVEPYNDGMACTDDDACTLGDVCAAGFCTSQANLDCDDGNVCTADFCHPTDGCVYEPTTEKCDDGNPCTDGDHCEDGGCVPLTVVDCDDGNLCTDDQCNPLLGCVHVDNILLCTDGDACTVGDQCKDGVCDSGDPVDCDDGNVCTDDSCEPLSGCQNIPNSEVCDDGNSCTLGDHCVEGACVPTDTVDCDDSNPCTDDLCTIGGGCQHVDNTLPCNDGDACTGGDVCAGGVCEGAQISCDDQNLCTDDSCDPAGGCVNTANTLPCDDGNSCTSGDTCSGGQCQGTDTIDCNDGNVCTDDLCELDGGCLHVNNTLPCNDGDACTGGDACFGGVCAGTQISCDDGNVCTDDSCEPLSGCQNIPNSEVCNDSNACTTGDHCAGGACVAGGDLNCDDGNPCTTDGCSLLTGCTNVNNSQACDDGDACTAGDVCAGGGCAGTLVNCDDGNVCTDDSCEPLSGCQYAPNTATCDDDNLCTEGDHCAGGVCVGTQTVDCDDGDPCTTDVCTLDGGCQHLDNTAPCEDGDPCTTGDTCSGGACQTGPGTLACSDGDPCTQDNCVAEQGCEFPTIVPCCGNNQVDPGETCDDGNQTGGDGCSADCKSDETCGNGIFDPATEICDSIHFPMLCHAGTFVCESDCQTIDTSGCSSWCGDGVIDATYEACEPGLFYTECYDGEFECVVDCKVWDKSSCMSWCGDGVANGPEDCDGMDFVVSCPLSQCWCSSDCKLYVDESDDGEDWDDGDSDGVNNEPDVAVDPLCLEPDTLCLDATQSSLQHLWIANANHHEVVRINVDNGVVEKEVSSHGMYPSRTAVVVADGSVWVGNRAYSSGASTSNPAHSNMVHLSKEGELICRADILGNVRAVGIDQNGDVWAGSWEQHKAYKVSGTLVDEDQNPPRCIILGEVQLDGCPYGAAGDSQGNIWFANNCNWGNNFNPFIQSVERVDIETVESTGVYVAPSSLAGCFNVYGMTVDGEGRILVGSYACQGVFRLTPGTDTWEWLNTSSIGCPRGAVVDHDGYIYFAISNKPGPGDRRHVIRVEPDFSSFQTLDLGSPMLHPVGVAIDRNGKLWTAGRNSDSCARIAVADWGDNPEVNHFPTNGDDPYTYSDMTGFQHLLFTNPEGTWTQNYDGGADTVYWKSAEWTGIEEPGVTDLAIRARSAAAQGTLDQAGWTAWITDSPANLEGLPNLRWLQVQVRLQSNDSEKTPILTGLSVQWIK